MADGRSDCDDRTTRREDLARDRRVAGIGRGIALRLAQEGCAIVAFTYHSDSASAQSSATAIEAAGAAAVPIRARLEQPAEISALFSTLDAELTRRTGKAEFDILVNNAGAGARTRWPARYPKRSTASSRSTPGPRSSSRRPRPAGFATAGRDQHFLRLFNAAFEAGAGLLDGQGRGERDDADGRR